MLLTKCILCSNFSHSCNVGLLSITKRSVFSDTLGITHAKFACFFSVSFTGELVSSSQRCRRRPTPNDYKQLQYRLVSYQRLTVKKFWQQNRRIGKWMRTANTCICLGIKSETFKYQCPCIAILALIHIKCNKKQFHKQYRG